MAAFPGPTSPTTGYSSGYSQTTGNVVIQISKFGCTFTYSTSMPDTNANYVFVPRSPRYETYGRIFWDAEQAALERMLFWEQLRQLAGGHVLPDTKRPSPRERVDEKQHRWRAVALRPRA